jgi:hypothetical protein
MPANFLRRSEEPKQGVHKKAKLPTRAHKKKPVKSTVVPNG